MNFQLEQAMEILSGTPGVLRAMLEGKSPEWVMVNYGPDTFCPFDVVGHLIHGEKTDWIPRLRMILEHGESRQFEPFDRYAMFQMNQGRLIGELLDEFDTLRSANLKVVRHLGLQPDQLALRGTHPAFGSVTLRQLLATWAVHDLNHIAQIAKAMAFQYEREVGPWKQYLSILKPPAV